MTCLPRKRNHQGLGSSVPFTSVLTLHSSLFKVRLSALGSHFCRPLQRIDAVLGHDRSGLRLNFGLAVHQQRSFSAASTRLGNSRGGRGTSAAGAARIVYFAL